MRLSKGLIQAYAVQDITYNAVQTFNEQRKTADGKLPLGKFDAISLGTLVKAWSEAQDRVRIHRNKPLPGVLKHEAKPKRGKHAQMVVLEPMSEAGDVQEGNQSDPQADQSAGQAS